MDLSVTLFIYLFCLVFTCLHLIELIGIGNGKLASAKPRELLELISSHTKQVLNNGSLCCILGGEFVNETSSFIFLDFTGFQSFYDFLHVDLPPPHPNTTAKTPDRCNLSH